MELKRGEVPEVVLNNLYKHTPLQSSFGIIMLAIVGGRPKVLSVLDMVESFIEFRREVVRRRTEFELRKAEARYHILEGLKIALDHLDEVIKLIRGAKTVPEARDGLMASFGLSQVQSQAILDMQLQRLTGLERQKILDEIAELLKTIERLRAILASEQLLMRIIMDELRAVREKYGDDRRSEFIDGESGELNIEDLIAEEDMAISASNTGYIKRTAITTYRGASAGAARGGSACARARRISSATSSSRPRTPTSPVIFSDCGAGHAYPAQGARNSRRRSGRQGQIDRESRVDGRRREDRGDARGEGIQRRQVHHHGLAQGRREENDAVGVQQPAARRRHHPRWASTKATR